MSYLTPLPTAMPSTASSSSGDLDGPVRVRIPADLDTPDRVAFGLTIRQLTVVGVFAVPAYLAWQTLTGLVPLPVLAAGTAPLAAVALVLAVGRRDGLPLDSWLLAALTHRRNPRRVSPTGDDDTRAGRLPSWAPDQAPRPTRRRRGRGRRGPAPHTARAGVGRVGLLRLPVEAIRRDGVITTGPPSGAKGAGPKGSGAAVVLVAARTVTSGLHTPAEQSSLLGGYARWLNQLSGPTQVVVSSRPVDLPARALRIAQDATALPHPALAQAALEHAEHLLDLCEDGDPRVRTVTIACTAHSTGAANASGGGAGAEALRRAERTIAALSGLGAECAVLDGARVSAVLTAAVDPFGPAGSWPRAVHGEPVTGPHLIDPTHDGWQR